MKYYISLVTWITMADNDPKMWKMRWRWNERDGVATVVY